MKRFVEGTDRGQSTLFPQCLEDLMARTIRFGCVSCAGIMGGYCTSSLSGTQPQLFSTGSGSGASFSVTAQGSTAYTTALKSYGVGGPFYGGSFGYLPTENSIFGNPQNAVWTTSFDFPWGPTATALLANKLARRQSRHRPSREYLQ